MAKPKVYIYSIFPWNSLLLHREHMLAKSFSKLGHEVVFVERSYKNGLGAQSRRDKGVQIVTIFGLPYFRGYSASIFKINDWLVGKELRRYVDEQAESWHILSSPLWSRVVSTVVKKNKIIYDISDNHLDFATNDLWKNNLCKYEKFALDISSLVVITSSNLKGKIPRGKHFEIIENGVDVSGSEMAQPILRQEYAGKIVGFIGGVYRRVNLHLIAECAKKYPEANFVIIGPTDRKSELNNLSDTIKNFYYMGGIPKEQIQNYFASFDVGIIPFVSEKDYPWLRTVDSVKVYQYAYYGYPIVTTKYGTIDDLEPVVAVADNDKDFIELVGRAIMEKDERAVVRARVSLAKSHDWTALAVDYAKAIESTNK